jgi:trimeric autotransporter adhesin
LYTVPSTIVGNQTITVMATSAADGSKTASATVNLIEPVAVTLSPNYPVSVSAGSSQAYTATVTGSANTAVTWSRNPVVGSLFGAGNTVSYVAPPTLDSAVSFTLTATSVADPTKSASVTVTVAPVMRSILRPGPLRYSNLAHLMIDILPQLADCR